MQHSDPTNWTAPVWHRDFGDATAELEKLREVGVKLLDRLKELKVRLDCFEEGYMCVVVSKAETTIAQIHVVYGDKEQQRFGIFTENVPTEDEAYFEYPDEVVDYFIRLAR